MGFYPLCDAPLDGLSNAELAAATGIYTLTGQDVALRTSRMLPIDAGSYILTGQDIIFKRTHNLDHGVYVQLIGLYEPELTFEGIMEVTVTMIGEFETQIEGEARLEDEIRLGA